MSFVADLYAAQPFWIWLAVGVLLLAVESMFSTEWLLWPAVSAGLVAVMTAVGVRLGLPGEVAVFAVLTVIATIMSRRLIQKANSGGVDINDRNGRLIDQRARVVEAFIDGRGRVFVSGSEWPAVIEGDAPPVGQDVIVYGVDGSLLTVRAPV
ncbi:NfeD family protein [Brevundimonas sp.]|jgi:inner membrane protein|uniref:NfeD family protein n=1 Tax=Brevundimonas sp. TaxID=1871086 RepID=UPI001820FD6C|nr:NfeD family protein [Brevundimonas sp.]MBA4806118.1 NfeD family protein [Brevundimonas sp.]